VNGSYRKVWRGSVVGGSVGETETKKKKEPFVDCCYAETRGGTPAALQKLIQNLE